jgi:ankyrin repeat protein
MSGSQSQSSNDALLEELIDFCRSETLSEDGLREIIERYDCDCASKNNNIHVENYDFFLWACDNERSTEGILRCLLEYFPDAASATDLDDGYTPLHIMMSANQNVTNGMVQLLIDACPESIDRANSLAGATPLHFLCSNKNIADSTAVDILGLLLERCPEAVRHAAINGALPIHIACGLGSKSLEFCRMLIEAYPGSERIGDPQHGILPFHLACRDGNVETAKYLLRLYPECINLADRTDGAYPIHYAINGLEDETADPARAIEMVQFLLASNPTVASQKRDDLTLPFSWVCKKVDANDSSESTKLSAALEILQILYDVHPEAIEDEVVSDLGDLPEEIQTFIDTQLTYARQARNSTLMSTQDENGQVPLHRALRDNISLGSIKLLVKGNPTAVETPDNSGALPLPVAIQHHDSSKIVDYLVGLDPNTLTAVDRMGNTALHLACRCAKYDTIALLLEKYDAVSVSQSNLYNKLPIHLLFESNAVVNREDDIKYLETVFQLLRANPETVMLPGDERQQSIPQGGRPSRNGKKRKYRA